MVVLKSPSIFLLLLLGLNLFVAIEARAHPKPEDDDEWDNWGDSEEEEENPEENTGHGRSLGHENHSPDEHKAHIMSIDGQEERSGSSGGNVANFNESCETRECNGRNNLKCDTTMAKPWKCACLDDYTYIRSQEKCFQIWKSDHQICEFDDQCHYGPAGPLSRCDKRVGKCECYDTYLGGGKREVVFHNGRCVVKRRYKEPCEHDAECQTTMQNNAYCAPKDPNALPSWTNATQVCQCQKGFVWDQLLEECLKIAERGPGSDCKSDIQCTYSNMGSLSRCNRETKKCECENPKNPGQDNVMYYDKTGVCYERKYWNMTCTFHDECKASLSHEAECIVGKPQDGIVGDMHLICQCPQGKTCPKGSPDGAVAIKGSVASAAALAIVVTMFFQNRY